MAITYVDGAASMRRGIPVVEPGFKIATLSTSVSNPETLTFDFSGAVDGRVVGFNPSVTVTVTGEVVEPSASATPAYTEAADTSVISAGFDMDVASELTSDVANILMHAYTDGGAERWFQGDIDIQTFGMTDINYQSSRDGLTTFTATFVGYPNLDHTVQG